VFHKKCAGLHLNSSVNYVTSEKSEGRMLLQYWDRIVQKSSVATM